MPEQSDEPDAFPEPEEQTAAAQAKLAADLGRLPTGTELRLSLRNGDVRTGPKGAFGAAGIQIDGHDYAPFSEVVAFETVRGESLS